MLQKNSFTVPSDTSGVYLVRVIQTRRCGPRTHAKAGAFLRVSLTRVKAALSARRKNHMRAVVIRSAHNTTRCDGSAYFFSSNAAVLLRRRMNSFARDLLGPVSRELRIKKFRHSFVAIF